MVVRRIELLVVRRLLVVVGVEEGFRVSVGPAGGESRRTIATKETEPPICGDKASCTLSADSTPGPLRLLGVKLDTLAPLLVVGATSTDDSPGQVASSVSPPVVVVVVSSASSFATVCFLLLVLQARGLKGAGTPNVMIAIAAADGAATTSSS